MKPLQPEHDSRLVRLPAGARAFERFDLKALAPFCEKSLSEETRRAYRRVTKEFFAFVKFTHPSNVTVQDVQRFRDTLIARRKRPATVAFKLSVVRSMFDYLLAGGYIMRNPALTKLVAVPPQSDALRGRALSSKEVRHLLAGPDKAQPEGARDYALMLLMLRTSLRVSEACRLRTSEVRSERGSSSGDGDRRWTVRVKVKGGRERVLPLPEEVKLALDAYLKLDRERRKVLRSDGVGEYIFQPLVNYRTLEFAKALSPTMAWYIVRKWGDYSGVGQLSPHDLRRTAITRALDQGLTYRQVQMMTGHRDPKTVMRYDHGRENLAHNAVNFLDYNE